jgi:hypothetical protein
MKCPIWGIFLFTASSLRATTRNPLFQSIINFVIIKLDHRFPVNYNSTKNRATKMKVLTLWQPYGQVIAMGLKHYETRSWATAHRGKIAFHASQKKMTPEFATLARKYNVKNIAYGEIILVADLTDCILMTPEFIAAQSQTEIDLGIWSPGRYAWKLENVRVLKNPIKTPGHQGLWNMDIPLNQ